MTFELIDAVPRLSTGFRIAFAHAVDEYCAIADEQERLLRAQLPPTDALSTADVRLAERFEELVAATSLSAWAHSRTWTVARDDREYLRRRQARARRLFLRAARKQDGQRTAIAAVSRPPPRGSVLAPASSTADITKAAEPSVALNLPAYTAMPAGRWLELYELLNQLPPQERPSRGLFAKNRGQTLWDWACGQRGLFPPPGRQPWAAFIGGLPVAIVARLLPIWAGMVGCAPFDARKLESALGRIGMAAVIEELDAAWLDALSSGAKSVPFTPFSWVPAQGTWYALMNELDRLQP